MPRKGRDHVYGPVRHGNRWRVILVGADGQRRYARESEEGPGGFASESAASEFVAAFKGAIENDRLVGSTLSLYLEHLKRYGGSKGRPLKPSSLVSAKFKIMALLQLGYSKGFYKGDRALSMTPVAAQRLYAQRIAGKRMAGTEKALVGKPVSADTHRGELVQVTAFYEWCVEQGWIRSNPWTSVKPEGCLRQGKEQLRLDEERALVTVALAEENELAGTAVLAALILGVRASELLDRTPRDIDDAGRLFWVPSSKTASGRRVLTVPDVFGLRERLCALKIGKGPTDHIFGTMTRWTLRKHVKRLCQLAGVPEVTTHALRGGRATRIVEAGNSAIDAARYLGHEGPGVTRQHYIAPGAEQSADAANKAALLAGPGQPSTVDPKEPDHFN